MARVTRDPQERRDEIIKAAQGLFIKKGFYQTKVSDIVKSINVSQGIFYYYFKSKEEIVDAIIDNYIGQLIRSTVEIVENTSLDGIGKLEKISDEQLRINMVENNNIHSIKGVDIHEKILKRLTTDYIPLMHRAIGDDSRETLFLLEIFFTSGNLLFDPGIFQWEKREKNERILFLISFMEKSLKVPEGSLSFYKRVMGYLE